LLRTPYICIQTPLGFHAYIAPPSHSFVRQARHFWERRRPAGKYHVMPALPGCSRCAGL
jgi:hypothetical protein